ncbi:MAG: membrane protein insertion efficiency factor YidD [Alphaproteobacteria bacterium]|jgi:putative membrane protein insertion efficiency factor|nr:membrane protein insertion efficiency factor YidD [Alphaproteobacteria bacterium]
MLKKIAIYMVHVYQCMISPIIGGRQACRFTPTCSEYTKQAIEKHGALRGTYMGIKRISRCRPGGGFGYDPVP